MRDEKHNQRVLAKSHEQEFLHILQQDYRYAPRVAEAILAEAQYFLAGRSGVLQPGQIRKVLIKRSARPGQDVRLLPKVEVIWTLDAGVEDHQVLCEHGRQKLRQTRIMRLLTEAVEQGGVATQEDLAHVLHISLSTVKRDFKQLQNQGYYLPCRGNLQGIGRGQTHKAQIVGRWLQGETYDQVALNTHHAVVSIQRYIRSFLQVIQLHRLNIRPEEIRRILQFGLPLVHDYLSIYNQHDSLACRARLEEHLQRLQNTGLAKKGGL
jgi:biotin operon repressor